MRKMTLMFAIRREINSLNKRIDLKIVRGESYEKESRKHKNLMLQLRRLESEASLARTFALASFMF
mgnify:CR=1 FL=1